MNKIEIRLISPCCADGIYKIKAKGYILAVLLWGNRFGPFPDLSPFAYVPIDPAGNGTYVFRGGRGIPGDVTHLWARCITHDFYDRHYINCQIPDRFLPAAEKGKTGATRFSVLSDLHLTRRSFNRTIQAMKVAESDRILLLGDLANDGSREQFLLFRDCLEQTGDGRTVFPVCGNHDITPSEATGTGEDGREHYLEFQEEILGKEKPDLDDFVEDPESHAYSCRIGNAVLIAMQCAAAGRTFRFPGGKQLRWIEKRLSETEDAPWRIFTCHAPLLAHNPNRNDGMPYLDRDKEVQNLLYGHGPVLFLSGHTHISPNIESGSVTCDETEKIIYADCGSVVPTDLKSDEGLKDNDWKDGIVTEITLQDHQAEICMKSVRSGIRFSRGYYRFSFGKSEKASYRNQLRLFCESKDIWRD